MDDLREGKGTYKSADGDSYNGLWRADKMNGHGTYTWADGGQYTGQWVNDGREGLGVYRSSPSDLTGPYEEKYDGWWKADKMHGQGARRLPLSRSLFAPVPLAINIVLPAGKYYWSNGDVYDGMWREDKRHGGATLPYSSSALGPHLFSWSQRTLCVRRRAGVRDGRPVRGRLEARCARRARHVRARRRPEACRAVAELPVCRRW